MNDNNYTSWMIFYKLALILQTKSGSRQLLVPNTVSRAQARKYWTHYGADALQTDGENGPSLSQIFGQSFYLKIQLTRCALVYFLKQSQVILQILFSADLISTFIKNLY